MTTINLNEITDIAIYRTNAKIEIDNAAGDARGRYITTVDGQELTYANKLTDAEQYLADGSPPDLTPYPWVEAEAEARGIPGVAAANIIKNTADGWRPIGVNIEKERIRGKDRIDTATTIADVVSEKRTAIDILDAI